MLTSLVLNSRTLLTGDAMDASEAMDVGWCTVLEVVAVVESAGTVADGESAQLVLKHAPTTEASDYLDFDPPISIPLTATGTTWVHVTAFTRFLGWEVVGTLANGATVTARVLGKGGTPP